VTLDRRDFLVRTGLLVGAGALAAAGCRSDEEAREAGAAAGLDTWEGVRRSFDLDKENAQLASFLLAAHPRPVREAIEQHRRRLDADTAAYLQDEEERLEAATLQAAAAYLGVAPQEIALTGSTTMGLGLLYATLALDPGEQILTTEHDFYSTHEALRLRARATGATVRRVRLYDDPAGASVDRIVSAIRDGVTPRTRAVALTWVHSGTGVKLPLREIGDLRRSGSARPCSASTPCTASAWSPKRSPISGATSSSRAATSGSSARAERASSGAARTPGRR
jgi:Aminotransferase class-V